MRTTGLKIAAWSALLGALALTAAWPRESRACTSAIVSGAITRDGRPILWKHRDTSAGHNFMARVEGREGRHGYVALYNGGDSLLAEAWMGLNDAGFAIMNTASYNLAPDTASVKDREGIVMRLALERCRTLDDFETLLDTLPRPLGVQANFGVLDASGAGAYYETDDYHATKFALEDAAGGYLIRTNYSCSGTCDGGRGYIREANARHLTEAAAARRDITPELLTDTVSRSFYHSLEGRDMSETSAPYIVDLDFVPRATSTATIAIVVDPDPAKSIMWTALGYPPAAVTDAVTLDSIPEAMQPDRKLGWESRACLEAMERKALIFDIRRGNGPSYINVGRLRAINDACREQSLKNYRSNK